MALITAEEARKITEEQEFKLVDILLDQINNRIKDNAGKGFYSFFQKIPEILFERVRKQLVSRGYFVDEYDTCNDDEEVHHISWAQKELDQWS